MEKTVIVINGAGGVGKDTLCEFAEKHYKVMNISSITPIKEIAAMCGYRDVYYFSRVFKEYFLVSPSKYVSEKTDG